MCAVCRPLFSVHGEVLFDGKIDIFTFTQQVAAKRSSKTGRQALWRQNHREYHKGCGEGLLDQ